MGAGVCDVGVMGEGAWQGMQAKWRAHLLADERRVKADPSMEDRRHDEGRHEHAHVVQVAILRRHAVPHDGGDSHEEP